MHKVHAVRHRYMSELGWGCSTLLRCAALCCAVLCCAVLRCGSVRCGVRYLKLRRHLPQCSWFNMQTGLRIGSIAVQVRAGAWAGGALPPAGLLLIPINRGHNGQAVTRGRPHSILL